MPLGKTVPEKRTRDGIGMSGRTGQESDRAWAAIKSIDKAMGILRRALHGDRPMRVRNLPRASRFLEPCLAYRLHTRRGGLVDHDEEDQQDSARVWPGTAGPRGTCRRKLDILRFRLMARLPRSSGSTSASAVG